MTTGIATKIFAEGIGRIEVSATMAITAAALKLKSEGVNLADFGAGEPHFSTPRHIKDAAIEAIEKNFTRYTNVAGIPEVRGAVVDRHACDFGSNYTPDECVFTTGGKLALFNAIQVLVDHGDEVILPVPYWVSFKDIIRYAGGKVVLVESREEENFGITPKMIEAAITPKTKAIILNTPSNPSGAVVSAEDLRALFASPISMESMCCSTNATSTSTSLVRSSAGVLSLTARSTSLCSVRSRRPTR